MIIRVESKEQLDICLDIVHKSFQTVAYELNLTKDNCPSHTAFIPIDKLVSQFDNGTAMFLYQYNGRFVGYFSLSLNDDCVELNNLAVLPEYRHLGIGKELVDYAILYSKHTLGASKIRIGIIEENSVLKEWYEKIGFVHIGTKKFEHLPFTVGFMETEV